MRNITLIMFIFLFSCFKSQTYHEVEKYKYKIGTSIDEIMKSFPKNQKIEKDKFGISTKSVALNDFLLTFNEDDLNDSNKIATIDMTPIKINSKEQNSTLWYNIVSFYDKRTSNPKFLIVTTSSKMEFDNLKDTLNFLRKSDDEIETYVAKFQDDKFVYTFFVIEDRAIFNIKEVNNESDLNW